MPRTIGRRKLLLGSLGIGASLLGWPVVSRLFLPPSRRELSQRLAPLLFHRDSACVVGREYLRATPGEATPSVLASLIAERLPAERQALESAREAELRRLLGASVVTDFEKGRTVELDGWVLSETEARLCALALLGERELRTLRQVS
jgi:hypothetical protein